MGAQACRYRSLPEMGKLVISTAKKFVHTLLLLSAAACGKGEVIDGMDYAKKVAQNLDAASVWVIQEGVRTYSEKGRQGVFRKLLDEWKVQLWVEPWVESDVYLARFAVKARGIHYEILNVSRTKESSQLYEFWVVKITASDWSGVADHSVFYVTETEAVYGTRKILERSHQFIRDYEVAPNRKIHFPVDDPKVLFDIEAWMFPKSYASSELKDIRAILTEDGEIKLIPKNSAN